MKGYGKRWGSIAGGLVLLGLAACGGGGGGGSGSPYMTPAPTPAPTPGASYKATAVVSDGSVSAAYTDARLKNAWGIAFNPNGFVWVANNGSNTSTLYDGNGVPQSLVVNVPGNPTGIVFNNSGGGFMVTGAGSGGGGGGVYGGMAAASTSGSSAFMFAGLNGTISGWSPSADAVNAIVAVTNSANGASYTGLAIAANGAASFIYAADFHNARIDVFDSTFAPVTPAGGFKDAAVPAGYAPFNVQAIGGQLYVTYAMQDAAARFSVAGAGLGMVDVFDVNGNLVKQLIKGGSLNAPWGVAMAPGNFGQFSNDLLVGNFGDGWINAFDPTSGAFKGSLSTSGTPIAISGLWGIAFGNGLNSQPTNTLFYAAGPNNGTNGLYGRIDTQ